MSKAGVRWFWGLGAVLAGIGLAMVLFRSGGDDEAPPPVGTEDVDAGDRRGAWVDEIVFTREPDTGKAVNLIESGRLNVFAAGISNPTVYDRIRDSAGVDYDLSYGSSAELTMNTAEFEDEGRINPFSNRRIREAMNWLIDRNYVANEIYGGLAVPRYLPIDTSLPDYARLAESARALELHYRHDPERATEIIHREMEELGAEMVNGRWAYRGRPVEIGFIIRTDDARSQAGDYISNLLEEAGFRVQRMYRNPEESSALWIGTDPKAGRWHLYTGGWASTLINRDLAGQFDQFYTPRGRPYSLWQAYDPDPEFDEIAGRLQRREYDTWDERQEMMARGLELAMKESTRVWLVDTINVWPRAVNVSVSADLAAGVGGSWVWPHTIRFTDRVGGRIMVGAPSFLTEPWNPVAGSNWIFDQMIMRGLGDSVVIPDPFTGLFRPQRIERATVTVQEGIPVNSTLDWVRLETETEIDVPEDTWIDWEADEARFLTVGEKHPEGITARTRTRVVYEDGHLGRTWHDGSRISVADVVFPWILLFARVDESGPLFDRSAVPLFSSFQRHFKGWRIVSQDPLEIEIYSDQIFPDAEWIAGNRAPGYAPWHMLALGVLAERNNELAFSSDKADLMGIEWMSFVGGPSMAILDRQLERARREAFVPYREVMEGFLAEGEVEERYEALANWRRDQGHFWVDAGPFYLHSARPVEGTVVLRRFADFPDRADKWLRFTEPDIPIIELEGPGMIAPGDRAVFRVGLFSGDEPYPEEDIERVGFMVFDSGDRLFVEGEAEPTETPGWWRIVLSAEQSAELDFGANSLEVAVTSLRVALPSFASLAFATVPFEVTTTHSD